MNTVSRQIHISYFDLERLKMLLKSQGDLQQPGKESLRDLALDLEEAVIVSPDVEIPFTTTMNSTVILKNVMSGDVTEYKLVFPGKDARGLGKLSVLTPVGAAVLGRSELDMLEVTTPSGRELFRIEEIVRQPEMAMA